MKQLIPSLIAIAACGMLNSAAVLHASDHSLYCESMYNCLGEIPRGCSAKDCTGNTFNKKESYCEIFKDLHARGLKSTAPLGRQTYRQISGKHRVEYTKQGTLPMPAEVLLYLMNNLPFAAQLINAYQGTDFQAAYLGKGRKRFTASGERLSGMFATVLQNDNQTSSLYYGYGTADILAWSLQGSALFIFDFEQSGPREITYTARCLLFPRSAFVRSILNFILFRRSITGELKRTFRYIEDSAMAFQRGERKPIENYPAFSTPEGRKQIEAFQLLLQQTMGEAQMPSTSKENSPEQTVQEPHHS